ncbi:MAG: L-aspartate oxidase [Verrucomicrobiota bacterium]
MVQYDFIVVGSGVAGLFFALKAAKQGRVGVLTKRRGKDSNTRWAQGGISCVMSPEDSFERHVEDTLDAGVGLCDEEVVRLIVKEGPACIQELIEIGVEFDRRATDDGGEELDLGKEGGHTRRRVLHHRDTTGREVSRKLLAAVQAEAKIDLLENHYAIDLITTLKLGYVTENRCLGIYALNEESGEVVALPCERVVLATGGCGRVYQFTTNPDIATGDGVAMAWRAGLPVANMEFIQFHPTCLYHSARKSFLITEAMRGEGAILLDAKGEDFVKPFDARGSLAPRDIVARAIDSHLKRTGEPCVYLDISHREADFIRERFPNIYAHCLDCGIDITRERIPVIPAAHYQCGGVVADVNGATELTGLSVIGEAACTGLHGANRLASNSILEALVMAHRAAEELLRQVPPERSEPAPLPEWRAGEVTDVDELVVIYHNWDEIRKTMADYVSIVRTDKRLQRASTRLRNLRQEVQEFYWNFKVTSELLELRNLVDVAAIIVESAARRRESRGLHFTLDAPETEPGYGRPTVVRR